MLPLWVPGTMSVVQAGKPLQEVSVVELPTVSRIRHAPTQGALRCLMVSLAQARTWESAAYPKSALV